MYKQIHCSSTEKTHIFLSLQNLYIYLLMTSSLQRKINKGLMRRVSLLLCSISMVYWTHKIDMERYEREHGARRNNTVFSVRAWDWSGFGTVWCFFKFHPITFALGQWVQCNISYLWYKYFSQHWISEMLATPLTVSRHLDKGEYVFLWNTNKTNNTCVQIYCSNSITCVALHCVVDEKKYCWNLCYLLSRRSLGGVAMVAIQSITILIKRRSILCFVPLFFWYFPWRKNATIPGHPRSCRRLRRNEWWFIVAER